MHERRLVMDTIDVTKKLTAARTVDAVIEAWAKAKAEALLVGNGDATQIYAVSQPMMEGTGAWSSMWIRHSVVFSRYETDEEYTGRLKRLAIERERVSEAERKKEAKERAEYERLKAKFGE